MVAHLTHSFCARLYSPSTPSRYDLAYTPVNTDIQDSLLGRVLTRVPVFPILQLLISALVLPEHNHDNALKTKAEINLLKHKSNNKK